MTALGNLQPEGPEVIATGPHGALSSAATTMRFGRVARAETTINTGDRCNSFHCQTSLPAFCSFESF